MVGFSLMSKLGTVLKYRISGFSIIIVSDSLLLSFVPAVAGGFS